MLISFKLNNQQPYNGREMFVFDGDEVSKALGTLHILNVPTMKWT